MLEKIIKAAQKEDWDFVDANIESLKNDDDAHTWASGNLITQKTALVDLAATLCAQAKKISGTDVNNLKNILTKKDSKWEFARFRAAGALLKHKRATIQAIDTLLEFTRHEEAELRPVANEYLAYLTESDVEKYCNAKSYKIETGEDPANHEYANHFHERTILKTVGGSIRITIDVGELELKTGEFVLVHEKEYHQAIVGDEGWRWQAMYSPVESKNYPGRH